MTVTQKSKRSPGPIDSWNNNLIGEQVTWSVGRAKGHKAFVVGFDFICKMVQLEGDSDDKALENMDFTLPYKMRDIELTGYRWTEDEYLKFKEKQEKQRSSRMSTTVPRTASKAKVPRTPSKATVPRTPPKVAKIIAKKKLKTLAKCKLCNLSIDEIIGAGRRPTWYQSFVRKLHDNALHRKWHGKKEEKHEEKHEGGIVIEDDDDEDNENMAAARDMVPQAEANLIGCHVVLCNLKDVAKNGTFGFVQSFNNTENKYYVKLLTNQHVMVNPDHRRRSPYWSESQ